MGEKGQPNEGGTGEASGGGSLSSRDSIPTPSALAGLQGGGASGNPVNPNTITNSALTGSGSAPGTSPGFANFVGSDAALRGAGVGDTSGASSGGGSGSGSGSPPSGPPPGGWSTQPPSGSGSGSSNPPSGPPPGGWPPPPPQGSGGSSTGGKTGSGNIGIDGAGASQAGDPTSQGTGESKSK